MEEKRWIESYDGKSDTIYQLTARGMDALDRLNSEYDRMILDKKIKDNGIDHEPKSVRQTVDAKTSKLHDFFICHATEDKEIVARPLAEKLDELGLDVWYDEFSLQWGRNLMKTIGKGINESRFGIVIFSPNFFEKKWAQLELDGLVQKLNLDNGEILPLLYNMTYEEFKKRLLLLSGILCRSWDDGLDQLSTELKHISDGSVNGFRKMNTSKTKSISKNQSNDFDLTLDKFTENGNHYVGIRNAKGRTVKSCYVKCNDSTCSWWDDGERYPRNIPEGGGGNVLLPRGFANTNPTITVMSAENMVEQIHLSNIPRRPSTKWNAEDENDDKVEWVNTTLGRIRSNFTSLRSLFQLFLDHPKVPILPEMKIHLSQKDELVDNTQTIVNQSASMLDRSWVDSLNDLCSLAKKNPWFLEGSIEIQIMQCNSCQGIVSQIDELLFRLPNPPV